MKLLDYEQATQILNQALTLEIAHKEAKYRLGQAIFNLLPDDLYKYFTGTEYDFFYWVNRDKVIECFYNHYVE